MKEEKPEIKFEISKSNIFYNDELYKEFKKQKFNFNLEIYLDSFKTANKYYDHICVWYSDSLYGNSYTIKDNEIFIKYIDGLGENRITITNTLSIKEKTEIIVNDIIKVHNDIKGIG